MKKTILQLVLIIATIVTGYAQGTLTLKQCIDYGLQNHLSVKVYQNNITNAHARVQEGYSGYLPQIYGAAQVVDNLKLQTTILPEGTFGAGTPERQISFGQKYNTTASVQVDQTIYDQGLLTGLRQFKPGIEISNLQAQINDETIIYNISYYYYQSLVYKQQLLLLKEVQVKYEKLLGITNLQVEKGVAKGVDKSRVQVNLNNTKSQINQAQNNYDLMLNRLKNAMGMEMQQPLTILDSIPTKDVAQATLLNNEEFRAENRTDFKAQQLNASINGLEVKRVLAGYAPKLSAYALYGAQAYGSDFGQSFHKWFDYSSIGLKLQVPIFDGLYRRSKTSQAKVAFDNSVKNLELNRRSYSLEFENSKTQLLRNTFNVQNDKENVDLAREVYNNTTLQYQQGIATMSDLLNAESSFKEAQTNYTTSLLNYYLARLDLEKSKGTIKNYYQTL